jgi:hypothetical protein
MIRPDQAQCIERRAGPHRDVAGQLALGKFVFVYVELKRRSRLSNSAVLLLPLTRGRFRHAPIGPRRDLVRSIEPALGRASKDKANTNAGIAT